MLIERPPQLFRKLFPGAHFRLGSGRDVFLTFDDGPIPEATPQILDILDDFGVKATFFMVGDNARKYPHLVEEILKRGHAVGNHTMHHLQGLHTDTNRFLDDIKQAEGHINSALFRPPHGLLRPRQLQQLLKKNFSIVMYDLITRDYSRHLSADDVFRNVVRYTRPGSIIVFHDSIKSIHRLKEALPKILQWLSDNRFQPKVIPQNPIEYKG